jgi:hypothetical protein
MQQWKSEEVFVHSRFSGRQLAPVASDRSFVIQQPALFVQSICSGQRNIWDASLNPVHRVARSRCSEQVCLAVARLDLPAADPLLARAEL